MSTKLPRLNVSMSSEAYEALAEFRRTSGMSAASLVSQIVTEAVPVIRALTEAYKVAKTSPKQAAAAMRDVVQHSQVQLAQVQLDLAPKPKRKLRRMTTR